MSMKIIKDSIHGYISLDETFAFIIDSPEFQRLKHIEQGSFRVLYPAARHDRYIHSLGTYHLATMFAENFLNNIQEDIICDITGEGRTVKVQIIKNTFCYAALLHDIGHAPFSHTTENFFKVKMEDGKSAINKQLIDAIQEIASEDALKRFIDDFKVSSPSPHEIISATILVKNAADFLKDKIGQFDLELAARMVIGCTYDYNKAGDIGEDERLILGIKNCFIRLLNSETVDVDKLDYITRDTQMSGFANVEIDIQRLVRSVTAIKLDNKDWLYPAFRKNALSVIDNVFRAKTEQSLWMVAHPVVLYDSELLSHCINRLHTLIDEHYITNVFSISALGKEGITLGEKKYRLLNDIDISADLRRFYEEDDLFKELYERQARRHPIWKSYYEFRYLFSIDGNDEEAVFLFFKGLMDYAKNNEIFVLNRNSLNGIVGSEEAKDDTKKASKFLLDYCDRNDIEPDFALIPSTNNFSPKFNPESVYVFFGKLPKRKNLNYTTYSFLKKTQKVEENRRLFYLYSKEKFSEKQLVDLRNDLLKEVRPTEMPRV